MPARVIIYIFGLLIMTLGIGASVKSNLGVSPVSSIPYTMTCVWGIEMGKATIIFHVILVLIQILLLRKAFKMKNLLQIPVGILFGYFTTFSNHLMTYLPDPGNFGIQITLTLISTFLVAVGIFFYVPVDIIPLAGEGTMLAFSQKFGFKFSNVKLAFDITMVCISLIVCLILIHSLGSVGIGTVVAAVLVGVELKLITRLWGKHRDRLLKMTDDRDLSQLFAESSLLGIMKKDVYTVDGDETIFNALKIITEKKVSGLPVVDKDKNLIGFVSDGDIIRFLADENPLFVNVSSLVKLDFDKQMRELVTMKVKDIARKKVITVDADDDLSQVCYVLSDNHIKKAPVMHDGKMIGMINISNITKYVIRLVTENA